MYSKICCILLLLGTLLHTNASQIIKDTATNPFIYHEHGDIEFETAKTEFSYQIDLSILSEVNNEYILMVEKCEFSPHFDKFYEAFFYNNTWIKIAHKKYPGKNLIPLEPMNLKSLKANFHSFKMANKTKTKCEYLSSIANDLISINNEFNQLSESIYTTISNVVSIETLLMHSYNITSRVNLTNALDFSHWFTHNFFKYTKISFKASRHNAFLTIEIPLFSHALLSKIYLKPILHNNIPYISNSEAEYVIEGQIGLNYFSEFNQNCFYANNKTFCYRPRKENSCDNQYISQSSSNFNEECFRRLPFQNVITQIKSDIYFLIIEPISVHIKCNKTQQTIRVFQPSKIVNNECFVNTTFCTFEKNSTQDYGIYFSKATIAATTRDIEIFIQLYCLFAFLLIYVILINAIIHYYQKLNTRSVATAIYLETMV